MAVHASALHRHLKHDEALYNKKAAIYTKDPEILESSQRWVNLYPLGFYNSVLMEDGTVYKLDEFGMIKREHSQSKRGSKKQLSVTLSLKGEPSAQYFVHIMLAHAFLPREHTSSTTVGFKDGDIYNLLLDNLEWV